MEGAQNEHDEGEPDAFCCFLMSLYLQLLSVRMGSWSVSRGGWLSHANHSGVACNRPFLERADFPRQPEHGSPCLLSAHHNQPRSRVDSRVDAVAGLEMSVNWLCISMKQYRPDDVLVAGRSC